MNIKKDISIYIFCHDNKSQNLEQCVLHFLHYARLTSKQVIYYVSFRKDWAMHL